jgi:hypothetical protein
MRRAAGAWVGVEATIDRGGEEWSNFDQQPRQILLADMLVTWRTCP